MHKTSGSCDRCGQLNNIHVPRGSLLTNRDGDMFQQVNVMLCNPIWIPITDRTSYNSHRWPYQEIEGHVKSRPLNDFWQHDLRLPDKTPMGIPLDYDPDGFSKLAEHYGGRIEVKPSSEVRVEPVTTKFIWNNGIQKRKMVTKSGEDPQLADPFSPLAGPLKL